MVFSFGLQVPPYRPLGKSMSETGHVDPICVPLTHSYRYQTDVVAASKNSMARPLFAKYTWSFALVLAFGRRRISCG